MLNLSLQNGNSKTTDCIKVAVASITGATGFDVAF